jgi:hypothetical protein
MPNFCRVGKECLVVPLLSALQAQPILFNQHPSRTSTASSPHHQVSDIWLRYNAHANLGQHFNDTHDSVWYPAYYALPELKPLIFSLMAQVQGERPGGVLITKLPPGGKVACHVDRSWHADYSVPAS